MKRKHLLIALALVMAVAMTLLAGCGRDSDSGSTAGGGGETYELTFAGIGSPEGIDTWAMNEIADRVAAQTDGAVNITVYPASQLGDMDVAYDEIIKGNIDLGFFSVYGTYDPAVEVVFLPYLTTDYDAFKEVYARDGALYNEIAGIHDDQGVSLLGFWPSGYVGMGFNNLKTADADLFDFNKKKDELIRVPAMESMQKCVEYMGYNTTVIAYSDVYTSMQTGVVDGSWNAGPNVNFNSFGDVMNDWVDYKACIDVYSCVMNTEKLESMPEEYQTIIRDTVEEVLDEATDKTEAQDEEALQKMRDAGITVHEPTDEQRAAMEEYFRENVWPDLTKSFNQDLIEQYK